jgi:hypothetical protein
MGIGCHRNLETKNVNPDVTKDSSLSTISGVLYVAGNEPFARLAVETDSGKVFVILDQPEELYKELWKLQGRKVELSHRLDSSKTELGSRVIIVARYKVIQ